MSITRHIGKLVNTDQKIVVVFMRIPGDDSHSLVVSTDNLTPRMEQAIMDVTMSTEGQADATLGNVLNRRLLPDTGENLLHSLHNGGLLRRVHVDQVIMLPMPNRPMPLRKIIEMMGGQAPEASSEHPIIPEEKYNPHTQNQQARTAEERLGVAQSLLVEAEDLERVARLKRDQAYATAPELAPKAASAPKTKIVLSETPTPIVAHSATKVAKKTKTAQTRSTAPKKDA